MALASFWLTKLAEERAAETPPPPNQYRTNSQSIPTQKIIKNDSRILWWLFFVGIDWELSGS
jgi:hypothetical protein